ncbi:hydrolase [Elizabethkingia meningoseptica]|uniref:CPCC family cysteine-rich protein n=1 Tax=Elizabethkingia meningoseptica TaxID=238 RepID=UPI000999CC4A|nr:CPCC family cysteine-rich protein [Elizabethkingia meningoseptica]MDE5439230.1 hydrolase [Elizabethkingia meningoseptica]MDE5509211.1 hydrolase [Elizabethkingia meningoseptica]MDE5516642.1 hydrolase [Elizabethkingia meningoseptica]MDE5527571.1 hydrolase [Elizabethkingia meningoseptica]MDE5530881.1 hydrolase [Elizabethkingia meningoseptica]
MNTKNHNHCNKCPCCGYFTLEESSNNSFQICPVCYWENDEVQYNDSTYAGGANRISLEQAKDNFKKFGAIKECFIRYVRVPLDDEKF